MMGHFSLVMFKLNHLFNVQKGGINRVQISLLQGTGDVHCDLERSLNDLMACWGLLGTDAWLSTQVELWDPLSSEISYLEPLQIPLQATKSINAKNSNSSPFLASLVPGPHFGLWYPSIEILSEVQSSRVEKITSRSSHIDDQGGDFNILSQYTFYYKIRTLSTTNQNVTTAPVKQSFLSFFCFCFVFFSILLFRLYPVLKVQAYP